MDKIICLAGTMRSGSTIMGHMINATSDAQYIGELDTSYASRAKVQRSFAELAGQYNIDFDKSKPIIDKNVWPNRYKPDSFLIFDEIWFVQRDFYTTWSSLKGWKIGTLKYLFYSYAQLVRLDSLMRGHGKKVRYLRYYDLLDPDGRARLFGEQARHTTSYPLNGLTGVVGRGDPSKNIRRGTLMDRNEKNDIAAAKKAIESYEDKPYYKAAVQMNELYLSLSKR